jgi:hypothetical protein
MLPGVASLVVSEPPNQAQWHRQTFALSEEGVQQHEDYLEAALSHLFTCHQILEPTQSFLVLVPSKADTRLAETSLSRAQACLDLQAAKSPQSKTSTSKMVIRSLSSDTRVDLASLQAPQEKDSRLVIVATPIIQAGVTLPSID